MSECKREEKIREEEEKEKMRDERREYEYLGDISALCFLHLPSSFSPSFPFLLAGTGSHLLLFDVTRRHRIQSFHIFQGLRLHLIASSLLTYDHTHPSSYSVTYTVAVSGERRVKLYTLCLHLQSQSQSHLILSAHFNLLHLLPTFTHWVLDLSFLQHNSSSPSHLAVGCSDNSVHLWDVSSSTLLCQVTCPERCLLYSMRMRGHKFDALHVASGTIFNEIVVWKLVRVSCVTSLKSTTEGFDVVDSLDNDHLSDCYNYEAHIVSRLVGHQGSIFCLSWSTDGSKLVSVSDDRSARLWTAETKMNSANNSSQSLGVYLPGPLLFGHGARVWDCCISDSLIVTVGEDCTCRVWGLDGKELIVIKEHMGRGIWRCLYDPYSSLLVTGGFDSAIKVRCLSSSSFGFSNNSMKEVNERKEEVFTVSIPNLSGHNRLMDSKSEYVRCLKFAREDTIYVATNHGYVYHGKLSDSESLEWTELARAAEEVPIICMDLLSRNLSESSLEAVDWVAVGDGKGAMKVIKVGFTNGKPEVAVEVTWLAEMERQLLGTYWCNSLGCEFVFTSNPKGMVKLWRLSHSSTQNGVKDFDVYLGADFVSSFGARIMCLDASPENEVLVCGDLRGNLVLFPLSKSILVDPIPRCVGKTPSPVYFKGAHGISTVSSITIARFSSNIVDICSTGADGCICYLEYNKDMQNLEFVGLKQIKDLSLVQSVSNDDILWTCSGNNKYAVGFSSTDFLIWNLTTETKLLQVKCGGWRRPHSYHLGCQPEISSSFAYVKDATIYIHRYRFPDGASHSFPCNLHLQFHGREIHTLCIISGESKYATNSECSLHLKSTWIATGCEDGTVRLTRFSSGDEHWSTSNLLGEHVGGSAVRSLCFVSKVQSAETKVVDPSNGACKNCSFLDSENPCLLISVGAKRVLTSWLLRKRQISDGTASTDGLQNKYGGPDLFRGDDFMSFKWLSTDMPVKCTRSAKKTQGCENSVMHSEEVSGAMPAQTCTRHHGLVLDNDWRYLAVTAFLLSVEEPRSSVCFVVVACSDATLTLRAFVLPYRYWFDVACLVPLPSPVLTLQHVVIPVNFSCQGNRMTKNIYIVISGSTDGSIMFWDLSEHVEAFMQRVPSFLVKKSMDIQARPRTGRGSQGGRWWRSIDASVTCERVLNDKSMCDDHQISDGAGIAISKDYKVSSDHVETSLDDSCIGAAEIKPLHSLSNVHQSGVNCLHVCSQNVGNISQYSIVSGGDDQALSLLCFVVVPGVESNLNEFEDGKSYSIRFLSQKKAISAHASAVKGVWTDGVWVFSVGLDQRVRWWKVEKDGNITEFGHFITSVPEPEALDVTRCGRECYQVAVAGRGMQIAEIFLSCQGNASRCHQGKEGRVTGPRCQFWLPKKSRFCSNSPLPPSLYCGNHSTRPNQKWVACPIDPSHCVLEDNLESHLKRCPIYKRSYSLSLQPYFFKGINCADEVQECDFTCEMKRNWVHNLSLPQFHHLLSKIRSLHSSISIDFSYKLTPASNTWIQTHLHGNIPYQHKHVLQQASILSNLEDFQVLPSSHQTHPEQSLHSQNHTPPAVVEFGAGRGYLTQMLADSYSIRKVFLVERKSYKFKADRSLRQNEGLVLERLRIDIEDLNLNAVESLRGVPFLAIGKHLCGPATDLTLRCCIGENRNQDNGTESGVYQHLRGIALATCCHHLCQWKHYTNKKYMLSLGISKEEFHAMTWFTSWAVDADHGSDVCDDSYSQLAVLPDEESNEGGGCASGVAQVVKKMKAVERAALGFMCKDIIDLGRFKWVEEHGFHSKLVKYVPLTISPENRLILAKPLV